jgi:hypothetical protein
MARIVADILPNSWNEAAAQKILIGRDRIGDSHVRGRVEPEEKLLTGWRFPAGRAV